MRLRSAPNQAEIQAYLGAESTSTDFYYVTRDTRDEMVGLRARGIAPQWPIRCNERAFHVGLPRSTNAVIWRAIIQTTPARYAGCNLARVARS